MPRRTTIPARTWIPVDLWFAGQQAQQAFTYGTDRRRFPEVERAVIILPPKTPTGQRRAAARQQAAR